MPFTHGNKAIDTMSNTSNFRRSRSRKPLRMMDGNERKNEAYRKEETHGPKRETVKNLNSHGYAQKFNSLTRLVKSMYSLRERTPATSIPSSSIASESSRMPLTTESKVLRKSASLINHTITFCMMPSKHSRRLTGGSSNS